MNLPHQTVPARSCGTCTLCCKVYAVPPMDKPRDKWCKNCNPGSSAGCKIWQDRPEFCKDFHCTWILDTSFSDEWKPERAKFIMNWKDDKQLFVTMDSSQPLAYRREPYYSHFKRLAQTWLPDSRFIVLFMGDKKMLLLPDGEQELGSRDNTQAFRVVTHLARNVGRFEIVLGKAA